MKLITSDPRSNRRSAGTVTRRSGGRIDKLSVEFFFAAAKKIRDELLMQDYLRKISRFLYSAMLWIFFFFILREKNYEMTFLYNLTIKNINNPVAI